MNYKLIIFDLDGTLTVSKSGKTFRETADDWQWLPGRVERCIQLRVEGAILALATNQAGAAFPWSKFTEREMRIELTRIMTDVGLSHVAACYTSPNPKALPQYREVNDPRRKPNPGMLLEAMAACSVGAGQTLYVGDRPEDEQAAKAAGVSFAWAEDFFVSKIEDPKIEIVWEDLFAPPNKDPDTMTVGELFSPCPECRSALSVDGSCRFCGGDPPTVQQIAARRAWLKEHPGNE